MAHIKKVLAISTFVAVLSVAAPAFAQTYGGYNGYTPYNPTSQYMYGNNGYNFATPLIYQVTYIPTYNMPSISTNIPSYGYTQYPNYGMPGQNYPQYSQGSYAPQQQYATPQYQPYNQYYGGYSYPAYDSSYEPYSNYYTTYPQDNLGYTGDHGALGEPICNWQGYGRSDCGYNPHQWVYDPYTGTWY